MLLKTVTAMLSRCIMMAFLVAVFVVSGGRSYDYTIDTGIDRPGADINGITMTLDQGSSALDCRLPTGIAARPGPMIPVVDVTAG